MKKILTITCHNVYNHGATLQQFALLEYLQSQGYDAATINYKPDYLSNHFNLFSVDNPRFNSNFVVRYLYLLLKLPSRLIGLKRKHNFDNFEDKYLSILPQKYVSNQELIQNLPIADIYITGSDQVWNSFFQNGKDLAFYLNFVPENKLKISYAASFAINEIDENLKTFVKENVQRLDYVSVRESSGKKILEDLDIQNVTQVLDPVFLIAADYWKSKFIEPISENYIFVYDFDKNERIKKTAIDFAKNHDLKIFTVNNSLSYASQKYVNSGPEIFLSLVFHAKFVLTNSFHAVAFSIIFNKKFLVFNRSEKINTRMRDLLQLIDSPELLVNLNENINLDTIKIDYTCINNIIYDKILLSKSFLEKALL